MFKIKYKQPTKNTLKIQNSFKSSIRTKVKQSSSNKENKTPNKVNSNIQTKKIISSPINQKQTINIKSDSYSNPPKIDIFLKQHSNQKIHRGSILLVEKTPQKIYTRSKSQFIQRKSINQVSKQFTFLTKQRFFLKIQNLINQVEKKLLQKDILQEKSCYYSIKKHHFSQILTEIINNLTKQKFDSQKFLNQQLSILKSTLNKILLIILSQKNQQKQSKLNLRTSILNYQYSHQKFQNDNIFTITITNLKQDLQNMQNQLQNKKILFNNLSNNFNQKFQQHKQLSQKYYDLCQQYQKQNLKLIQLKHKTSEHQDFLNKIQQKVNQIVNFDHSPLKTKILYFVNQSFQNLQNQLFSYAQELQHCNFIHQPLYDPEQFKIAQKWIWQKMDETLKEIKSSQLNQKKKIIIITQFLQNSIFKLRQKNEQLAIVARYKTECFTTFTTKMQAWTDTFTMKQQYLKTLREQFVAQSMQADKLFKKLQDDDQQGEMKTKVRQKIQQLKNIWKKRQSNYQRYTFF